MESKLYVELLRHTPDPEELVAMAARLCYSQTGIKDLKDKVSADDQSKFIEKLISMGHLSPLEHICFTYGIEGISRAASHQLVRHRIASYSQQSQRYVDANNFDYITPPTVKEKGLESEFMRDMDYLNDIYVKYKDLYKIGNGSKEDARFVLPNAAETKIIVTMNARELLHFFSKRTCNRAQWEIRAMAKDMLKLSYDVAPTIFKYAGPGCVTDKCHEGSMSCGRPDDVRKEFARYLN